MPKGWTLVPVIALAAVSSGSEGSFARVTAAEHVQGSMATFRDPTGDAPASVDVSTVSVSSGDGVVTFAVTYAERVPNKGTTVVYLDSDRNASTGAQNRFGADYAVIVSGGRSFNLEFSIRRWTGRRFKATQAQAEDFSLAGRVLTFKFDASDVGKARSARFVLTEGTSGGVLDSAPDAGRPPWRFHVASKKVVRLEAARLRARPRVPVAGDPLVASMRTGVEAPIDLLAALDVPSCEATVAGRRLAPLRSSLLKARGASKVTARCTWRVPPGTSGELLRASVAVNYEGRRLTRRFSSRIR